MTRGRVGARALVAALGAALLVGLGGPASAGAAKRDRGDFRLSFAATAPAGTEAGMAVLRRHADLKRLVRGLNAGIRLPRNIRVVVDGSDGPYYDPSARTIVMSPDFSQLTVDLFRADDPSGAQAEILEMAGAVSDFVFLHEAGHALVHQLRLPITGREEDAVDDLAIVLMSEVFDKGESALAASYLFGLFSAQRDALGAEDFFDEHSLDEQRFYAIGCHVYGSSPRKHKDTAKALGLPAARQARCRSEYRQMLRSWTRLLDPYLK